MRVILARTGSRKDHMRKPQGKRVGAAKQRGTWRKTFYKLKNIDETTFLFSCGSKGASTISKSLDERMFFVDSGACMHIMSKRDQSPVEMDTLRRLRTPTTVVTANGEVQANEEAQVYVDDLGLFVAVPLLEETPAVISLGKLCKEHGYSCEWVSGQEPRLTQNGKIIICKTDNFVLLSCQVCHPLPGAVRLQHQCRIWHPQHHKIKTKIEVTW